jgi:hypothetical protein
MCGVEDSERMHVLTVSQLLTSHGKEHRRLRRLRSDELKILESDYGEPGSI